jgi:hypothetical protein
MRKLILLTTLLIAAQGMAQTDRTHEGGLGLNMGIGLPQGGYADTLGKDLFTFGAHLAIPSRRMPFQVGFAFNYGVMGRKTSKVIVTDEALQNSEGRMALNTKVLSYHPFLRFTPLTGGVRPYVDGIVGLRHFSTKSKVTVDGLQEPLQKERHSDDMVLSSGWAAGVMVMLGGTAYLEARVERMYSGKATYVDPNSITIDSQGNVGFSTLKSSTGTLNALLGVGFRF